MDRGLSARVVDGVRHVVSFDDTTVAFLTVKDAERRLRQQKSDYGCLWWCWAAQQAWRDTEGSWLVLEILTGLLNNEPGYFACLTASCIAYTFGWTNLYDRYTACLEFFVRDVGESDRIAVKAECTIKDQVLSVFAGLDDGVLREMDIDQGLVCKTLKHFFRRCDAERRQRHKAIIASQIMVICVGYPKLLANNEKLERTVKAKIHEFRTEKKSPMVVKQLDIVEKAGSTLFQKSLRAWAAMMRHRTPPLEPVG